MKALLLTNFLMVAMVGAVEPLEPRSVANTPRQTLAIALNPEITTMLVFPEEISMIVGAGLTDGTAPGLVQFDHRKGSAVMTVRPLQEAQPVFAQVIAGESVYFCRLTPEARPDSVVTIAAPTGNQEPLAAVPIDEVVAQRLAIPEERLRQLIELTRSASTLSRALPDEFLGSEAMEVSMASSSGAVECRIEKIRRFAREDTLVFFGTITNRGNVPVHVARLSIAVGDVRKLTPNLATITKANLGGGESIQFECVLAGDGQGRRTHLSLKNQFSVQIVTTNP